MKPRVYLAFVDDWELSGTGSGNIREIQFEPMRELVRIYNSNGIRGSFNAEMMQQLTFRKFEAAHPELKLLADEWDEVVRETYMLRLAFVVKKQQQARRNRMPVRIAA